MLPVFYEYGGNACNLLNMKAISTSRAHGNLTSFFNGIGQLATQIIQSLPSWFLWDRSSLYASIDCPIANCICNLYPHLFGNEEYLQNGGATYSQCCCWTIGNILRLWNIRTHWRIGLLFCIFRWLGKHRQFWQLLGYFFILSFLILLLSVLGLIPSNSAAPSGPWFLPLVIFRARRICSDIISSSLRKCPGLEGAVVLSWAGAFLISTFLKSKGPVRSRMRVRSIPQKRFTVERLCHAIKVVMNDSAMRQTLLHWATVFKRKTAYLMR